MGLITQQMLINRGVSVVSPDRDTEHQGAPLPSDHKIARKLESELSNLEIKAKYKVEIQFGKNRSISALKPSTGVLLIWESGRRFHGGGDQQMYWCGYDDCAMPMSTDNFAQFSVVCPHCKRESFLDQNSKKFHLNEVRKTGGDVQSFRRMPIVYSEKFFKLTPAKIAELIERVWRSLGCNADIYLKYHPSDIRYQALHMTSKSIDQMEKARHLRGLHIYTLARILRDTSAGAEVRRRFLAFITA